MELRVPGCSVCVCQIRSTKGESDNLSSMLKIMLLPPIGQSLQFQLTVDANDLSMCFGYERSISYKLVISEATSDKSLLNWCPRPSNSRMVACGSFSAYIARCAKGDRKSTRLNSVTVKSRMPSSA